MRKVTMVVEVLITNCQVSLKPNTGPLIAQTAIIKAAMRKAPGLPLR